jgi:hypothetical protein
MREGFSLSGAPKTNVIGEVYYEKDIYDNYIIVCRYSAGIIRRFISFLGGYSCMGR